MANPNQLAALIPDPLLPSGHPLDSAVPKTDAETECLATALKACLSLVEFADASNEYHGGKAELLGEAIVYARKAVELGSKLPK